MVITTDREVQFTSRVWREIVSFFGAELRLATIGHYQTVGKDEHNNAYVETYLKWFVKSYSNNEWMDYLYLAEFCYNNSIHASTKQSPFLALYNYQVHNSPQTADLVHSLGEMKLIDSFAHNLGNLKHMLEISQDRYIGNMNKKRKDDYPRYRIMDLVWLRKPEGYDALSFYKLASRKFGPFKVIGEDPKKRNYRLDISRSPFPNM